MRTIIRLDCPHCDQKLLTAVDIPDEMIAASTAPAPLFYATEMAKQLKQTYVLFAEHVASHEVPA